MLVKIVIIAAWLLPAIAAIIAWRAYAWEDWITRAFMVIAVAVAAAASYTLLVALLLPAKASLEVLAK